MKKLKKVQPAGAFKLPKHTETVELAFGPRNWYDHADIDYYLSDIPKEFRGHHYGAETELSKAADYWRSVVDHWFFRGIDLTLFTLNEQAILAGIDAPSAFNYLKSLMVSFQPKHEHKTAVIAHYLHLWFKPVDMAKLTAKDTETK